MVLERERLIRLPEVLELTGLSKSTLYRKIKEDQFPAPVSLGPGSVAWRKSEVLDWIANRPVKVPGARAVVDVAD